MADLSKYHDEALKLMGLTCAHPLSIDADDQILENNPKFAGAYPVAYIAQSGHFCAVLVDMRGDIDEVLKTWRLGD